MIVRCPACKALHADPPLRFPCTNCGRGLAWQALALWLPQQLTLFQPLGTAEPLLLPLADPNSTDKERRGRPAPEAGPPPPSAQRGLLVDAIALVTGLLPLAAGQDDVVPAILADQTPDRLLGLATTAAWLASTLVTLLDEVHPGSGTDWLQALALGLASNSE